MSKNVLILSASPRKGGNSDVLCDEFLKGVLDSGHTGEKIRLSEHKINPCRGCTTCNTIRICIQKDDMANILNKMKTADVIVMATPVYFYSMNGQMKTLIDRTFPSYGDLSDKDFYFIVTAADPFKTAMVRTIEGFRGFLECLDNPHEKGIIYGAGVWKVGEVKETPAVQEAYEMGLAV